MPLNIPVILGIDRVGPRVARYIMRALAGRRPLDEPRHSLEVE
jgi:hypothetical protein